MTIDRGLGWTVTVDAVWLSPDGGWFGSDIAHIFDSIAGFSFTGNDNIGLRYAYLSSLEDLFNAALALIADVTRWRVDYRRNCDTWVAAHVNETEVQACSAFAHDRLTFDTLDELHEWIESLAA
ncbi:hypothetical protein [Ferrimicrobium acidiphilum]|uniref:hypothetical protein n=1 Tax=Ferrimicrobium acidiphilum TaxID=121039 RepID=UPI0023F015CB|nr:hypothetical protein [Ferrimicrobium acidiphilum]